MRLLLALTLCFLCCGKNRVPTPDVDEHDDVSADAGVHTAPVGFLHRSGTSVVDGDGNTVRFRGVAVGGWFMWEGWLWGGGYTAETVMFDRLVQLVGLDEARAFRERVYEQFVTEADFAEMQRLGFNAVRIPLNHFVLEGDAATTGFARLDHLLDLAERHGLYVVLDLHGTPCGQSPYFISDPDSTRLWDSSACQDQTVAWWRAVAEHFAGRTIVAGYDLLNEPAPPNGPALVAMYRRLISAVREVDGKHLVIIEGDTAATDFSMFSGRLDENQLYSSHFYYWGGKDPVASLAGFEAVVARDETPMWMGEMGLSTKYADTSDQVDRIEASTLMGWSYWSWKMTGQTSGSFLTGTNRVLRGITGTDAWNEVAQYLSSGSGTPPTAERAKQGMNEFIDAVAFANTRFDPLTADALRPQLTVDPQFGSGSGLTGHYFSDTTFTREVLTRVDATIDFDWGAGSPDSRVPGNDFSVRWTGTITAPRSEWFLFTATADDQVTLFVDDRLLTAGTPVRFTAGEPHAIRVEYVEKSGLAKVKLGWESARTAPGVVPPQQLQP